MSERIEMILKMVIRPTERVVAMTSHRDYVLIVTDLGTVYKYWSSEL